jgi:DNA-binding MarR family transcriptional regulator
MSRSAMAELVDDLEDLGYLKRRPDPLDRRAKPVCLTESGRVAIRTGRSSISTIETEWGKRLGPRRFDDLLANAFVSGAVSGPTTPSVPRQRLRTHASCRLLLGG